MRSPSAAFRVIACDQSVDDGLRSSAAEQLPELDPRAAAEAFRVIVSDPSMDDGLRASAAEQLAGLNPRAAVWTMQRRIQPQFGLAAIGVRLCPRGAD